MSTRTTSIRTRVTRALSAAWPQVLFALLIGLLLAARMGRPVRAIYPLGALAVGWSLQRSNPVSYVSFLLWLWFLTPLVRRMADLYGSWQEPSTILLTPYLVTALSAAAFVARVIRRGDIVQRPVGLAMFGLAAMGTAVGLPLGFVARPQTALLETFNYITPLCLGVYVALHSDRAREIEQQITTTFGHAALVVGLYGLYQFATVPPWDASWMVNSEMATIGRPEPFAIRVFSTMHGPGVLGVFLAVALVLWIARPRAWGFLGTGAAAITLLLSQVRSAWLACLVGAVFAVASLKPAQKVRVGLLIGVAVMFMAPLLVTPEMTEMFEARISTLQQLDEDQSGMARLTGHELALDLVTRRPLGLGIGQTNATIETYISMRDSTIVAGLLQFGLVGALLYFTALGMVALQVWRYYRRAASADGVALACSGLGLLSMAALGVISAGPMGMLFWLIAGLAVADRHRSGERQTRSLTSTSSVPPLRRAEGAPVPA